MSDFGLDQVVELALKLKMADQAKLLERVSAHLAHEFDEPPSDVDERLDWTENEYAELTKLGIPKTGAEIAALIDSGELNSDAWSEMINPHITDPVEWVRALRRDMSSRRNLDWDNE